MKELINTNKNLILEKSIKEVIEDFLLSYSSIKTKNRYKTVLKQFFDEINILSLAELWEIHLSKILISFEKYKNTKSVFDSENTNKVLNPASINNIAYIIRAFFKYLIVYYNYPKNPLIGFKPLATKEHSTTDSLDRNELLDILKASKMNYINSLTQSKNIKKHLTALRNYLIFALLSLSLRREEICNIKWSDLNDDSYFLVQQKGGTYKYIPIPSWLLDFFLKYRSEKTLHNYTSAYIFTPFLNGISDNLNKPISADYIMKITQQLCRKLHINKKITPHSFRKTFIEISLNKNENYINIMNATWHKTSQMIRYYDYRDKVKNNAINAFGDMFY